MTGPPRHLADALRSSGPLLRLADADTARQRIDAAWPPDDWTAITTTVRRGALIVTRTQTPGQPAVYALDMEPTEALTARAALAIVADLRALLPLLPP